MKSIFKFHALKLLCDEKCLQWMFVLIALSFVSMYVYGKDPAMGVSSSQEFGGKDDEKQFLNDVSKACQSTWQGEGINVVRDCIVENVQRFKFRRKVNFERVIELSKNKRCAEAEVFAKYMQRVNAGEYEYAMGVVRSCDGKFDEAKKYLELSEKSGYSKAGELLVVINSKFGNAREDEVRSISNPRVEGNVSKQSQFDGDQKTILDGCLKDVGEFKKSCYLSSLACASRGYGAVSICQQQCDEKILQYRMRCYSPNSPMPSQQPKNIIIQNSPQVQQGPNPSVCVQDGGGMYCPNHPNTRKSYPMPFGK